MSVFTAKLKEVLLSVLPITFLVVLLNFTLTPIETPLMLRFLIGAVLVVIGLTIFLLGVEIGITPIGNSMGSAIAKTNKLWILVIAGLVLGFAISIAEPDLQILAGQIDAVTSGVITQASIVLTVSIGIAILLAIALMRIVYNIPLYKLLTVTYGLIFILSFFVSREFLAISFDASGTTTGALAVPFMLALTTGISNMKKDSKASEKDSFGMVAIVSTGAILAVMIMSVFSKTGELSGSLEQESVSGGVLLPYIQEFPKIASEIAVALLPIVILFLIFQKGFFKLSMREVRKILFGIVFTFLGLVVFLTGVNAGFMDVGSLVGYSMASLDSPVYVVVVGFVLGLVTMLAEPAVHVLTHQIEDVTSGYVKRSTVMVTLSISVGIAIALSIVRILVPQLQLWHYLLPGYVISIAMSYFVPKLFVGIAFDSGGVATGPMTATFTLAYAQGAAEAVKGANVIVDGFGVIAMVAMTPLIALQILGLVYKIKSRRSETE